MIKPMCRQTNFEFYAVLFVLKSHFRLDKISSNYILDEKRDTNLNNDIPYAAVLKSQRSPDSTEFNKRSAKNELNVK